MVDYGEPAKADDVTLLLLDSAQGHPIQSWRFSDHSEITIGREPGNNVVIADPHVSRIHARLVAFEGAWTLISMGRHGTLVNDRLIAELELRSQTIFRLGPNGPSLRFETGANRQSYGETIENINPEIFAHARGRRAAQAARGRTDRRRRSCLKTCWSNRARLRSERHGGNQREMTVPIVRRESSTLGKNNLHSFLPRRHGQVQHHRQPLGARGPGRLSRRRHRYRYPVARHPRHLSASGVAGQVRAQRLPLGQVRDRGGRLRRDRRRDRRRPCRLRSPANFSHSVERQRRRDRPHPQRRLRRLKAQRRLPAAHPRL